MYSPSLHDPILPHVQTFWEYALACISSCTFHPNINNPILPHVQTFQEYKLTCLPWGNTLMCACIEKRLNGKEEGRFIWDTFHLCWCCPVQSAWARSTLMLSFRDGKRQIKFLFSRKICRIFQPKRISDIVNDGAWKYYFLIRFFLLRRRDFRAKIQLLGMGLNRLPAKIDKEAIKFTPSSTNYTASTCSGVWLDAFLFTIHLCRGTTHQ